MTTFTDKELIKEIKERISSLDVRDNIERRAYEIALASLEAEPVAWMRDDADGREYNARNEFSGGGGGIPLYATPQVQVVPEEMYWQDAPVEGSSKAAAYATGWNACRAAMLHSAEPASNHEELPLDYLQGQKDGLEWAAQLAEANHPQTGDWLYDDPLELAKAIRKGPDMPEAAGNSPVIPDGWVMVPKELTPEMMRAVQIRSELGGYATSNLSGAYNMFSEFWNVAVSAAPKVDDL